MKKLLFISAIGICVTVLTAYNLKESNPKIETSNSDCKYGQCIKIKDDGYRCKNCAQKDSYYCWSHRY
jgi:hypothetical protein